ncbi:hypothetical protein ACFO4E_07375 [Nocardiopsis mangrovi]|uniref:DUF2637 domain-containing protein n=1 Tax=Nocardiopsis mangrovi TaxID=1179818 RepID=A0ABV9DVP6_9ACTN
MTASSAPRPSWFFGTGATAAERALACLAGLLGAAVLGWTTWDLGWPWWKYLVGAVVVFDLAGVMIAPSVPSPEGFAWLPAVLLLKLVLAHAVPEEPYPQGSARAESAAPTGIGRRRDA